MQRVKTAPAEINGFGNGDFTLAGKKDFHLLISDIGLPDGRGYDLMMELGKSSSLKGIALSGYGMECDIARSQSAGFAAHLTKPVRVQSLETALAAVFPQ